MENRVLLGIEFVKDIIYDHYPLLLGQVGNLVNTKRIVECVQVKSVRGVNIGGKIRIPKIVQPRAVRPPTPEISKNVYLSWNAP